MSLAEELQKIIKGDVADDAATLKTYSHDASLFEVRPEVVVFPKDAEDVKSLVKFTARKKAKNPSLSLTARSGGTDMSGGSINDSIIIDFTRYMNHIKEIVELPAQSAADEAGGYAVVEPGVFYRDFEKETLKKNLLLPSYPASRGICALGGMVANNSGGEKTLAYGKTENYVMELKVILADGKEYLVGPLSDEELHKKLKLKGAEGELYRKIYALIKDNYRTIQAAKPNVSKNSAGYLLWNVLKRKTFDLAQLLVGSQGTLGIVTEIKFRLIRPKKFSKLIVIFLDDLAPLVKVIHEVLKHKPESFESYDDHTFKLALRFWRDMIKVMKPKNFISLGLRFLPEAKMILFHGFPKLALLAEFTGDDEAELKKRLAEVEAAIAAMGVRHRVAKDEEDARKYWTIRRESFNLLRKHLSGMRTAPFIDDVIVRPENLPEFLPALNKILEKYPELIYTIAGHAGDGNFHVIPLMDMKKESVRNIIPKLSEEVYDLVKKFNGSFTAEHNDGLIRSPYLEKMYGSQVYALFKRAKEIFDPQNIFNPRKKIGASLEYAMEHIVAE